MLFRMNTIHIRAYAAILKVAAHPPCQTQRVEIAAP
jgi:hypothetical protein